MISAADRKVLRDILEKLADDERIRDIEDEQPFTDDRGGLRVRYTVIKNKLATQAIALLDKPTDTIKFRDIPQPHSSQVMAEDAAMFETGYHCPPSPKPESAGDARELAEQLASCAWFDRSPNAANVDKARFDIERAVPLIQAFASRIRSEALEEAAKIADEYITALDIPGRIRSLKPTGTP